MNVLIEIKYLTDAGRVVQGGNFPLKGRTPEEVALEWLQQIKRTVTYRELISVTANGNEDITDQVKELENALLDK